MKADFSLRVEMTRGCGGCAGAAAVGIGKPEFAGGFWVAQALQRL